MATLLTINDTPDDINPVYREVKWRVTSTDLSIKAVRADLYINNVFSTTINGVQVLGTTDQFTFDVRKIMQSDLVSELRTNITLFKITDAIISAKTIHLRLFEIVETGGVFTTTWASNGTGTNFLQTPDVDVTNTAIQHQEDFQTFRKDTSDKVLLTTKPDNVSIPRGIPFQLGFISSESSLFAIIDELDANLNNISTTSTLPLSDTSSGKGIIEIPSASFSNPNTAFIDIHIEKTAIGDKSITHRFKIVDNCTNFTIFFQNHLGGFDHFDFSANQVKNITTQNQRFTKPLPSGFAVEDAGTLTIESRTKTKIKLFSGSISSVELDFLQEIVKNHTVIYKWDSPANFLRFVLVSHSTKVEDKDGFINSMTITIEPSNEHIVQKGD